ncbi:MAG: hypothetical protein ACREUU_03940, partial [Gammaproteobacteria bacterium]
TLLHRKAQMKAKTKQAIIRFIIDEITCKVNMTGADASISEWVASRKEKGGFTPICLLCH